MDTIQLHSQGEAVRKWQEFLNGQGAQLEVDGIFGAATQAATVKFQGAHGLEADGIVGPLTWTKATEVGSSSGSSGQSQGGAAGGPGFKTRPSTTRHKLGFYVQQPTGQVLDRVTSIQPRVILGHAEDVTFWTRVRQSSPNTLVIGRLFVPLEEQSGYFDAPEAVGQQFAERILAHELNQARVDGQPLFDAWMSFNEAIPGPQPFGSAPTADDAERYRRYDRFQVAFATQLRTGGFEPVAMNFANMNWAHGRDWLTFFKGTLDSYDLIGFHEYGWPTMLPGPDTRTGCLGYRQVMADVRQLYGSKHSVIITEAGLARIIARPDGGDVGWLVGDSPVPWESYADSLASYNAELMKDDYVIGACLYQVGHGPGWDTFELATSDEIMGRIAQL